MDVKKAHPGIQTGDVVTVQLANGQSVNLTY